MEKRVRKSKITRGEKLLYSFSVITNDIILTIDLKDNYVEKTQDKNTNESEKTT